jgi:hypothetical protein
MRNPALELLADFDNLHDRMQDLPHHGFTPLWMLKRLDALIERLEELQRGPQCR